MSYIGTNLIAIAVATLAGLLVGTAYLPAGGVRWKREGRSSIGLILIAAIAEFWLASILAGALILAPVQANAWIVAIGTAVVIWIGFVVPALVTSYVARGLRASATLADCAHWLLVMSLQAATLHLVGLVRP